MNDTIPDFFVLLSRLLARHHLAVSNDPLTQPFMKVKDASDEAATQTNDAAAFTRIENSTSKAKLCGLQPIKHPVEE